MTIEQHQSKTMNRLLWAAQAILAASLLWAAATKLFQPAHKLAAMWPWTAEHYLLVKLTGALDALAAIGLVLPALLRIQPKLTVYSAYGVLALMVTASIFHIVRGEAAQIGINIFFAALAIFIVWGRMKKTPS